MATTKSFVVTITTKVTVVYVPFRDDTPPYAEEEVRTMIKRSLTPIDQEVYGQSQLRAALEVHPDWVQLAPEDERPLVTKPQYTVKVSPAK